MRYTFQLPPFTFSPRVVCLCVVTNSRMGGGSCTSKDYFSRKNTRRCNRQKPEATKSNNYQYQRLLPHSQSHYSSLSIPFLPSFCFCCCYYHRSDPLYCHYHIITSNRVSSFTTTPAEGVIITTFEKVAEEDCRKQESTGYVLI